MAVARADWVSLGNPFSCCELGSCCGTRAWLGPVGAGNPVTPLTWSFLHGKDGQVWLRESRALSQKVLAGMAGNRLRSGFDLMLFRRKLATIKQVARSPAAGEATLIAAQVADTRLALAQVAAMTATLLQDLGPVLVALQPTKDAVIRTGALLIVKVDWTVNVFQLTAAQQAMLDHRPQLASCGRSRYKIADSQFAPRDCRGPQPQARRSRGRISSRLAVTMGQPQ
jgi:hypothetical protein